MGLSLRNIKHKVTDFASRAYDQGNIFDNGRTFQQRAPTNNRSILSQTTHNGLANTIGNFAVKPVFHTITAATVEPARMATAWATYNQKALHSSLNRERQNIAGSIPGFVGSNVINAGQAGYNLGFKAPILDLKGNAPAANRARTQGLKEFNNTTVGQATRPLQYGIANVSHASPNTQAEVGLDPHATGAQKFFADPVVGALGTYGLMKGGKATGHLVNEAVAGRKINKAMKNAPVQIPVKDGSKPTVTKKEQVKITQLEGKQNLTKQESIQEAVLREKAGLPPLNAKGKPTVTAKEAPPGQNLLNLPKDTESLTVAKTPGAWKRAWQSTRGVISQYGTAGKELANRLQEHRFQSETGQEKFLASIPTVGKLKPDDFTTFVKVLDARSQGKPTPNVPTHIQQAVVQWNRAIPSILERARAAGVDVGDLGPNYFPRVYKDLFSSNSKMNKMAEGMVRAGKATSFEDAIRKLKFMQKDYIKSYGNLERTRSLDMPGYEMTHDALTGYVARAMDRITKAEQFGPNGELIDRAMGHMMKEGYNAGPGSMVDRHLKIALGDVNKDTGGYKFSSGVRKFNALRSLNTAAISNASQTTNTAAIAGIGRTLKAIGQRLDPISQKSADRRANAKQAGVELDHTINNLSASQLGVKGKFLKNVASPFFHTIEKFNRTVTAMVGEDYANHLLKKGDHEELRNLGVTGEIGKTLTKEQTLRVQSKLVERSQFKVDPQDLPGWADSAMGKLAAQFRTFGYKQTGFMWNEILRQALKGNVAPLGRFLAVGVPVGSAQLALKGAIKNQPMTGSNTATQSLQALGAVGGGGLPGSEGQNLVNGIQYNDPVGAVASTVGGPTISVIAETGKNVTSGMKNNNWRGLAKEGVRSVPVVGPAAAGRVFPKQDYKPTGEGKATKDLSIEEMNNRATKEKAALDKGMKPGGYGITKLSNGSYWYQVGNKSDTTTDLKKAKSEVAKDQLKHSDQEEKIIGDKVYYKDSQGDIHTMDKALYDYNQQDSKTLLELDRAYESSNFDSWMNLAQKEYDIYEAKKQFYNPNTEQDKIDDLTLKQENLMEKAQGYQDKLDAGKGFGRNKKGATGGSGRGGSRGGGGGSGAGSTGSIYKYAVSGKAAVSIAGKKPAVNARSGGGGRRRVYRASMPKVSLKKSRV